MVKVGIIGSGFGTYGLLPAFSQLPDCQVVALTAAATPRVQAAVEQYHVGQLFSDWQQMLTSCDLDAVATAITPAAQAEVGTAVLTAGKDWWAEKPLAATLSAARHLSQLANQHAAITAVDFIFPEIPVWQRARTLVTSGALGDIQQIEASWDFLSYDLKHGLSTWKTNTDQGGGAVAFFFSHVLYYLEWLLGPMEIHHSRLHYSPLSRNGGETGADIQVTFAQGAKGTAHINCAHPTSTTHRVTLIGSKGQLELLNTRDVVSSFELHTNVPSAPTIPDQQPSKSQPEDERVAIVASLAKRFIAACQTRQPLTPSVIDGLRVQEHITQILATAQHTS